MFKSWRLAKPFVSTGALRWDQVSGKIDLPAGKIGNDSGVIAYIDGGLVGREIAHLSYSIQFDAAFPFNETAQPVNKAYAGKLPGFTGGPVGAGYNPSYKPDGFNGFLIIPLWRCNSDGSGNFGDLSIYCWDMHCDKWARETNRAQSVFTPGKVHKLEQQIILNTVGKRDGVYRLWVDQKLVSEMNDIEVRTDPEMTTEGILFCCFFGGSTLDFAPPRDTWIRIDQASIKARECYIG